MILMAAHPVRTSGSKLAWKGFCHVDEEAETHE